MKPKNFSSAVLALALLCTARPAAAQLFDNLRALGGTRYAVGDPSLMLTNASGERVQGPKDIAVADFDGDAFADFAVANKDGTVTLRFAEGDGTFGPALHLSTFSNAPTDLRTLYFTNYYTNVFCNYVLTNYAVTNFPPPPAPPVIFTNSAWACHGTYTTNFQTNVWSIEGPTGLRGLAVADFTGDGLKDIAVASPGESVIHFFKNLGNRAFAPVQTLPAWFGVRDLAAGDFDGDGWPDLAAAGSTNGVAHYRSLGNGEFQHLTNVLEVASSEFDYGDYDFPQPAYYLKAVRQPGDTRDELLVSFAQRGKLWVLRADTNGSLAVAGDVNNVALTALDAAPLLSPASNGIPDLVTSYSRGGRVDIYPATNLTQRFSGKAAATFFVPGGPRNVRIADLDGDGWNDLVVVSQLDDQVLVYRNDQGRFDLISQGIAGRSPREMDLGDFNGDLRPDLAVLNRFSSDVSIMITASNLATETGFLTLNSVYPVDGGVSGLELRDLNGDGRLDVLQLHRDSGEFSVRTTDTNGQLSTPIYYPITNGFNPAAQITADVNGDGRADMISANLSGSVTVRLGLAGGGFGEPQTYALPADAHGSLFALVPGDFNGDGHVDLAAGYLDCRVSFFQGGGNGQFVFTHTHPFIYEPRSMVVGDFDQDGDLDLAGGSWAGQFVVVENKGDLLTTTNLTKRVYNGVQASAASMQVVDQNNDGDPDFLFGSEGGFALYMGGPGLTFVPVPINNGNNNPGIASATFVYADLNGDGISDIASVCNSNSCLTISVFTNNQYLPALTVPVPFTRYLAAGDLDGDGFADLIGSGDVLWVALSGHHASNAAPAELLSGRNSGRVVINELLAQNVALPLAADGNRTTDWVEIYNGSAQPMSLTGWQLALVRTNVSTIASTNYVGGSNQLTFTTNTVVTTNRFTFPGDTALLAGAFRLVICSDNLRTLYHSGFNLPAGGATLLLFNAQSVLVDRVDYPALDADLSYARYQDGLGSFVVNNIPSPGVPNVDNGAVEPVVELKGIDLAELQMPGSRLHFRATARDDQGIVNLSVLWRRLDVADAVTKRLILFDDGMSGDDQVLMDGNFTGVLNEDLPEGAAIQFYLECTDISDQVVTKPGNARFASPGQSAQVYTFALGVPRPPLEISEMVADNVNGLTDEQGGTPDWVEIRNCSTNVVSLAGIGLSPKFFGDSERLVFTNIPSLAPGQHLVIYADSKPGQGPLHAPFKLSVGGEQLLLTGTMTNGARFLIDSLVYGPQAPNRAWARLGCAGPWVSNPPTPGAANVATRWQSLVQANTFLLAFPTRPDRSYTVQYINSLQTTNWVSLPPVRGSGLEQTVAEPLTPQRFFRVREE